MGRKLTFSKEKALNDIMRLFWSKGYEATSVRDIAQALDVPIASIYHSFGDKKAIFLATLNEYFDIYVKPNFEAVLARENSKQAILELFHSFSEQCDDTESPPGCYLVQTAGELSMADEDIAAVVKEKLDYIRLRLKTLVEQARRNKQITTKETSENLSQYLFATMLAVKTWSRTGVGKEITKQYLRLALKPITDKNAP